MSDESASVMTSMAMETVKLTAPVSMKSLCREFLCPISKKNKTIYSVQPHEDLDKAPYSHSVPLHPSVQNKYQLIECYNKHCNGLASNPDEVGILYI